jgi:hypothetical protein
MDKPTAHYILKLESIHRFTIDFYPECELRCSLPNKSDRLKVDKMSYFNLFNYEKNKI